MEAAVKRILDISLIMMVIGIFAFVGNMAYQESIMNTSPELNWWFAGPMVFFSGLSILCIALMCVFEIIHICTGFGMKWYGILIVFAIIVIIGILGFILFCKFDFPGSKSVTMAFSLAVTGFTLKAYQRISDDMKQKK